MNLPSPKLAVDLGFPSRQIQLLEILASYLVRLMERLKLLGTSNQAHLVETAPKRWDKDCIFSWKIKRTKTKSKCHHFQCYSPIPVSTSLISTPILDHTEVPTRDTAEIFDCCYAAKISSPKTILLDGTLTRFKQTVTKYRALNSQTLFVQDDELEEGCRAIPTVDSNLLPTNASTESMPCTSCGMYSTLVDEEGICAACVLNSCSEVWTNSGDANSANIETENPFDHEQSLTLTQWQSVPTTITPSASIAISAYPILDTSTVRSRKLAFTQSSHEIHRSCADICYCEPGRKRRYQTECLGDSLSVLEEGYAVYEDDEDVEYRSHVDCANLLA